MGVGDTVTLAVSVVVVVLAEELKIVEEEAEVEVVVEEKEEMEEVEVEETKEGVRLIELVVTSIFPVFVLTVVNTWLIMMEVCSGVDIGLDMLTEFVTIVAGTETVGEAVVERLSIVAVAEIVGVVSLDNKILVVNSGPLPHLLATEIVIV